MKNKFILLLLFSIFIFQFVSAVEFNMKSEYAQGESIIAEISGNFLERLAEDNIYFYRGHVKIPMLYDFAKIENKYYLYVSLLGKTPANYSVVIEGAKYMKGAEKIEQDIVKNFSISESTADFSLDKGFLLTEKGFSIEVQNLQDSDLEIKVKDSGSVELSSGQIKELYFGLNNFSSSGMNKIELTSENLKYEIPVYILGEFVKEPETKNEKSFKFEPGELNFSMPTNSETSRIIYLYNNGNVNLEDISFSISNDLDSYVSYSVEEIKELFSEESRKITLDFSSDEAKTIQGTLKAKTDELEIDLDIYVGFLENYVGEEVQEVKDPSKIKTCEELGGIFCGDNQECSIDKQYAKDGNCCLETCQEPEVDNSGKIIGWIIVIAIVVVLIWFFKSKAKIKNMPDLMKQAKGRK
ncbi:MAG: hypothetical protein KJ949_03375 [Nanoarchaeota archaeon]|nr:hypothetical protein [Nanoarchaeota archaeon]